MRYPYFRHCNSLCPGCMKPAQERTQSGVARGADAVAAGQVHGDLASSNVLLTRRGAHGACGVLGVGRLRAKARPLQRAGPCTQCFAVPRLLGWSRVWVSDAAACSLCTPRPSHRFPGAHVTCGMEGRHVALLSMQALCLDAPCGMRSRAESALRGGSRRRRPASKHRA